MTVVPIIREKSPLFQTLLARGPQHRGQAQDWNYFQRRDRLETLDRLSLPTLAVSVLVGYANRFRLSGQIAKTASQQYSLASPVPISAALAETGAIKASLQYREIPRLLASLGGAARTELR